MLVKVKVAVWTLPSLQQGWTKSAPHSRDGAIKSLPKRLNSPDIWSSFFYHILSIISLLSSPSLLPRFLLPHLPANTVTLTCWQILFLHLSDVPLFFLTPIPCFCEWISNTISWRECRDTHVFFFSVMGAEGMLLTSQKLLHNRT